MSENLTPSKLPTIEGPLGIRYDFNCGCRVYVPKDKYGCYWRVQIQDEYGNALHDKRLKEGIVESDKKYFVRFSFTVWYDGDLVFGKTYDARDKEILVYFASTALGDTLAWVPACDEFQRLHGCKLTVVANKHITPLFAGLYPNINFEPHGDVKPEKYYASYMCGLYLKDRKRHGLPRDCRDIGLHHIPYYLLGLEPKEVTPKVTPADGGRPINQPYVCIATQATTQAKYWNNPLGWHEIVKFLKEAGYRVVCIDRDRTHGRGIVWNHIPHGVEDQTGNISLEERVRWLKHAEFFVGLPSGLSWLAWAANTPVVMISGFSAPHSEFYTPYRVTNVAGCTGCWNDPTYIFDNNDYLWCPRHQNKPRMFECTRIISSSQVKDTIRRIPGFKDGRERREAQSNVTPHAGADEAAGANMEPRTRAYKATCRA